MRVVDNVGFDVKKQDIPGGSGGSGSGQPLATPDWNQNDETAADYIKNRPFYTADPLVNGTFAFVDSGRGFYMTQGITIELTAWETYKVTLDGVEYETVCRPSNGVLYIGSMELVTGGTPAYPFLFMPSDGGAFATNISGDSHDIVIKDANTEIVKLPEQYIPEMSSVTLLSSTTDSTKKFKITVDDSGTLKATEVTG